MIKDSTRRTVRTTVQVVVGIAVMLPMILQAPGVAGAQRRSSKRPGVSTRRAGRC